MNQEDKSQNSGSQEASSQATPRIEAQAASQVPDEAAQLWQNYQGKRGKKEQSQERSSAVLYGFLGILVLAIIATGLWIVVFR